MSQRTLVHLVRHGEVYNPDRVLYGRLPGFGLSDLGRQMADQLAAYFVAQGADIAHLAASPLERAQQTAAPTAAAFGLDLHTEPRIIEAENSFEGLQITGRDGALRDPRNWWRLRNPARPSWGEPYTDQVTRMLAAAGDARHIAHGREAVLVSHQLPVWMARSAAEGRRLMHDPRKRECTLASVTTLVYLDTRIVDVRYAEPCAELLAGANPTPGA
ncbi:MAG: histidine phosphatase family protein [Actinomycetales bacterium]